MQIIKDMGSSFRYYNYNLVWSGQTGYGAIGIIVQAQFIKTGMIYKK
jgi:hypothetical protein